MKTPHTITLIYGEEPQKVFNPITGEYEEQGEDTMLTVPCLLNFITQEQQFIQFGTRNEKIAIVRFNQEQEPFQRARFKDELFVPIDQIDAPIKGAVRLRRVVE